MLTINNINKSFYHRSILEDISFNVNQGDTIALLGRNGIGKSTLLRILGKISQPDKGNILYNNSNIYKEKASVRKGILYLGHDISLYPSLSAIENIKFACTVHGKEIKESRIITSLNQLGLSNRINDQIKIFSKGMLQSLKYVLADLIEWNILFFDEPFSFLDLKGRKIAQDYIDQWNTKSKTMIFATHDPKWSFSYCSRLLLLDDRKIKIDKRTNQIDIKQIVKILR